jgi:hypothetical protein
LFRARGRVGRRKVRYPFSQADGEARTKTSDFTPLYGGESVGLSRTVPAYELTKLLAEEAQDRLKAIASLEKAQAITLPR